MSDVETEEVTCELVIKPALYIMEARLPMSLVDCVNDYIDTVRDLAADHSASLVGQIKQDARSAQLHLDLAQKMPATLAGVIAQIGEQYVTQQGYRAAVT